MTEQCEKRFDKIDDKLDEMDKAIRGNGKPGLKQRVDKLEASNKWRGQTVMFVVSFLGNIATPVITALVIYKLIGK